MQDKSLSYQDYLKKFDSNNELNKDTLIQIDKDIKTVILKRVNWLFYREELIENVLTFQWMSFYDTFNKINMKYL